MAEARTLLVTAAEELRLNSDLQASMCGMKMDCGGAAGVLYAFYMAVKENFGDNLHAVLCLAENSVGSNSMRVDDIITLHSGKLVDILKFFSVAMETKH